MWGDYDQTKESEGPLIHPSHTHMLSFLFSKAFPGQTSPSLSAASGTQVV